MHVTKSLGAFKVFSIGLKVKSLLVSSVIFLTTLENSMCPLLICKKKPYVPLSHSYLHPQHALLGQPLSVHMFSVLVRGQRAGL